MNVLEVVTMKPSVRAWIELWVAASSRRQKSFGTPFGHRETLKAPVHSDSLTSREQKLSHTAKLQISQ